MIREPQAIPTAAPANTSLGKWAPDSIRCRPASVARIANHQQALGYVRLKQVASAAAAAVWPDGND